MMSFDEFVFSFFRVFRLLHFLKKTRRRRVKIITQTEKKKKKKTKI
tara:strand:- start:1031 stop:1168 length:138 start_codon:yes stop_codon:yes gene_type:complete